MSWGYVVTLLGALGGLEFLKWLWNRKASSRIALAEAESKEFHVLQETMEFLQRQLRDKEERFAEQTQLVRKQNTEVLELTRKLSDARLELAMKRCDEDDCPFRRPPNANTPPRPGVTIEQYHASKTDRHAD